MFILNQRRKSVKTIEILVEFFQSFVKTLELLLKGLLMNSKTRENAVALLVPVLVSYKLNPSKMRKDRFSA